jgi:hypothetical protein
MWQCMVRQNLKREKGICGVGNLCAVSTLFYETHVYNIHVYTQVWLVHLNKNKELNFCDIARSWPLAID